MGAPTAHVVRRSGPVRQVIAAFAVMAALAVTAASPAMAATYRYWGFYELKASAWAFAPKGPDQITPPDGSVEGWRFAVAGESDVRQPRAVLTFDAVCGSTAAQPAKKRVAVVIDYGRDADADADTGKPPAPRSACAVVDAAATSAQVLSAVATPRVEKGLVCALDNWPASGCGGEVKTVTDAAKAADTPVTIAAPSASPAPTSSAPATGGMAAPATSSQDASSASMWLGFGALALALAILVLTRRRRQASERA